MSSTIDRIRQDLEREIAQLQKALDAIKGIGATQIVTETQQPLTPRPPAALPPAMISAIQQHQSAQFQPVASSAPPYLAQKAKRIAEGQKRGR